MLVNWKCAVASKFRGRATKSNQTWAKQRLLRLVRASSNFLTVRTRGRVSPLGFPLASVLFEFSVFSTFNSNFLTATTRGKVSPLLFPLASLTVAASSNAPPSFHRAARGSFRRRRSPERRAVGIPPLPIIIQCSPLFLFLSHVVDTLANIQTRKT